MRVEVCEEGGGATSSCRLAIQHVLTALRPPTPPLQPVRMAPHNVPLVVLGTFLLWFGWYGFNPGSWLAISGNTSATIVARTAVTTTLGGAAGGCASLLLAFAISRTWELTTVRGVGEAGQPKRCPPPNPPCCLVPAAAVQACPLVSVPVTAAAQKHRHTIHHIPSPHPAAPAQVCNGALAGLVAITAGCALIEPWAAIIIGALGAMVGWPHDQSHCLARHCLARHCLARHCLARHCLARHCLARHCLARHCLARHCLARHCLARHCLARHCLARHSITQPMLAPCCRCAMAQRCCC